MLKSRKFYYALFVIGALYVLIVQQFFKNESHYLIQTKEYNKDIQYKFEEDFQELYLPINKDVNLHGIWFKHNPKKALVLIFPDSDLDLRQLNISKNQYYNNGFDVLITEYRGSGKSLGKLVTEDDLFYDAQNWYNFAKSQFSENEIILVGQGFGGAVAAHLSGNNSVKALILENPFYSNSDYYAKSKFWWLPYKYFTSFQLATWKDVRKTTSKIILIQDETKKGQEVNLINYLKDSDAIYWLKASSVLQFSFQAENEMLFKLFLDSLYLQN